MHMGSGGLAVRAVACRLRGHWSSSAVSFIRLWLCLSEETLKAVSPFYLMSMPGEVKYHAHTQGNGKTCCGLTNSREGNVENKALLC